MNSRTEYFCKGSFLLGTACGKCGRCEANLARIKSATGLLAPEDLLSWKLLHKSLDVLMAGFIAETGKTPSEASIMDLAKWSFKKTQGEVGKCEPN